MAWTVIGAHPVGADLWADGADRALILTGGPTFTFTIPTGVTAVTVGMRGGPAVPATALTETQPTLAAKDWLTTAVDTTPGDTWTITLGGAPSGGPSDTAPLVGGTNGGGSGAAYDDTDGSWYGCGGGGATTIDTGTGYLAVAAGRGGYAGIGNVDPGDYSQTGPDETWPTTSTGSPLNGDSTSLTGGPLAFYGTEGTPAGGGGGGWPGGATGPTTKPWGPGENGTTLLPTAGSNPAPADGPDTWADDTIPVVMLAWTIPTGGWTIDTIEIPTT